MDLLSMSLGTCWYFEWTLVEHFPLSFAHSRQTRKAHSVWRTVFFGILVEICSSNSPSDSGFPKREVLDSVVLHCFFTVGDISSEVRWELEICSSNSPDSGFSNPEALDSVVSHCFSIVGECISFEVLCKPSNSSISRSKSGKVPKKLFGGNE